MSTKAERTARDQRVLALVVAGRSYRQVADAVGLRSVGSVARIVQRELGDAARRAMGTDLAGEVLLERSEALFSAHFGRAIKGDYKSSVICLRLMAQLQRSVDSAPDVPVPDGDDLADLDDDVDDEDELARYRIGRKRGSA